MDYKWIGSEQKWIGSIKLDFLPTLNKKLARKNCQFNYDVNTIVKIFLLWEIYGQYAQCFYRICKVLLTLLGYFVFHLL